MKQLRLLDCVRVVRSSVRSVLVDLTSHECPDGNSFFESFEGVNVHVPSMRPKTSIYNPRMFMLFMTVQHKRLIGSNDDTWADVNDREAVILVPNAN